ncbi:cytochrome d ubiquinol oxidase subunit II [Bacteroidota bacterium]
MFGNLSHLALQQYWWVIISLLASLLVFLMFVQGGQTLIFTLGKKPMQKTMLVNALGRKWEFTFTTLVTFGGAFFASFPLFYSTSFGGAYWVWMAILFCFIIQAIAYEFRSKPSNFLGQKTYDVFLFINGTLATILIGTAVGTFFNGSMFSVNEMYQSRWEVGSYGLEAVLNWHNVALGLTVFFLARILGLMYFIRNIEDEELVQRCRKHLVPNTVMFLLVFLAFAFRLLLMKGFAYDPDSYVVAYENFKYLHNFLAMPLVLIVFLAGIVLVLFSLFKALFTGSINGFYWGATGTVLVVFALFLVAGLNKTCFYPSIFDMQSSLHIENASSSHYTLTAMSWVSLLAPLVLVYIYLAWSAINNKKIDPEEMESEPHVY